MNYPDLNDILETVLAQSPADWTGVIVYDNETGLTRLTNNAVHQNVVTRFRTCSVSVVMNGKMAACDTNQLDRESLARTLKSAMELASFQQTKVEELPPLGRQTYSALPCWDESIAQAKPALRGQLAETIINRATQAGATAAGSIEHTTSKFILADSSGVYAPYSATAFRVNLTMTKGTFSGWSERASWKTTGFDVETLIDKALGNAIMPRLDYKPAPGVHQVILEPQAVANLLELLSWNSFDAKSYYEKTSSLSAKLNQQVTGDRFNLSDNAFTAVAPAAPFDGEGHPRSQVSLIENGFFKNMLHDRVTAKKYGTASTGHCIQFFSRFGPKPSVLVVQEGDKTLSQMIAESDETFLVTRFHYNRPVDPRHAQLTGVTRDGLFYIKNGKVTALPYNFRYNERVWEALDHLSDIGTEAYLCGEHGQVLTPALKIKRFTFTETI